jgi:hypothetical protein
MKVEVIGSTDIGRVIQGKVRIGQEIVIRHKGKVKIAVVVRTRRYTKTKVSYDIAGVVIKEQGGRARGPIAKGVGAEIEGQSRQLI